jgi:hypothetical protein
MRRLGKARLWFSIAAVLGIAVLFVDGTPGGIVAVAACAAFLLGCFRGVMASGSPDDRAAATGWFGGWF